MAVLQLGPAEQGSLVSCVGQSVLSTGVLAPGGWYTGELGKFAALDKTVVSGMSFCGRRVVIA